MFFCCLQIIHLQVLRMFKTYVSLELSISTKRVIMQQTKLGIFLKIKKGIFILQTQEDC